MESGKAPSGVRKMKKKQQVKGEMDRIKQAEKKKRRLEKALATSAAIRTELEKKKERKREEQQRLDEEGAAIAETVALHVLLGEDSDDSHDAMLKEDIFMGERRPVFHQQNVPKHSFEGTGWVSRDQTTYECMWNESRNYDPMICSEPWRRDDHMQYYGGGNWDNTGISPHLIVEQAISSLHIADIDSSYVHSRQAC